MDNPLLAMLKSAASGPPVQQHAAPTPPPQIQAVSIDDLFKSISSTPASRGPNAAKGTPPGSAGTAAVTRATPPAATVPVPIPGVGAPVIRTHSTGSASSAVGRTGSISGPASGAASRSASVRSPTGPSPNGSSPARSPPPFSPPHQAKLLGMLSLGGGGERPGGTDEARNEARKSSLLNVLKSPPTGPSAVLPHEHTVPVSLPPLPPSLQQVVSPVMTPTTAPVSAPSNPSAPAASAPTASAAPPAADATAAATPPAPPAPPKKSIFDFVSPFDVFDTPRTTSASPAKSVEPVAPPPAVPVKAAASASPLPSSAASAASVSTPASAAPSPVPPAPTQAPLAPVRSKSPPVRHVQVARHSRRTSAASASSPVAPTPKTSKDLGLPWLASKVAKNVEGSGPKSLPAGSITIDLSKPNADALANAPGSVQIVPTTIMKAENVAFQRGRSVATTKGWFAYTLPRGRVRLIDWASGARTVIQLEGGGSIIDIAASPDALAVVGVDGAVSVFRVPQTWERDDPSVPLIFRLGPIDADSVPPEQQLGDVNRVEWVKRDGPSADWLVVGGTDGVVFVKPSNREDPHVNAREVLSAAKVLKTNGVLVSFCINAMQQAIGLLSSSGHFCLYSVANLNRVWQRQLPASTSLPPTSVRFCEANILVGRGNDTVFDLVQITQVLAILTTVKFVAPAPSPPALHFAHAEYDTDRQILYIAPFARGSVYALHYALKGHPPFRDVTDRAPIPVFDTIAEFPLDPVLSFVLGAADSDIDLLYATPNGINQAQVDRSIVSSFPKAAQPTAEPKKEKKAGKKDKSAQKEIVQAQAATPAPPTPTTTTRDVSDEQPSTPGGLTADDLAKALRKSEDRVSNQLRQAFAKEVSAVSARLDEGVLTSAVSAAVSTQLKSAIPTVVATELNRVLPSIVSAALDTGALHAAVGRDLERALAPAVPRTIATVVQPAVERAVNDAVSQALVPALNAATTRVYDTLAAELKREMVQIRKDVVSDQGEAHGETNAMIRTLAANVAELQKQVAALSVQNTHANGSMATAPLQRTVSGPRGPLSPGLPSSGHSSTGITPVPASLGTVVGGNHPNQQPAAAAPQPHLEDAFLQALGQQTVPATLKLVSEFASQTDAILPTAGRSPLSQAVLLTLLHRLSSALPDIEPHNPLFQTAATWLRRAAGLIDVRDPAIATYFPRVASVVAPAISSMLAQLQRLGNDPMAVAHTNVLRSTLDVVHQNTQQAAKTRSG